MIKKKWKSILLIALIVFGAFYLFDSWANKQIQKFAYSDFLKAVEKGQVVSVAINMDGKITGQIVINGVSKKFLTVGPYDANYVKDLIQRGTRVEFKKGASIMLTSVILIVGLALVVFLTFFIQKRLMRDHRKTLQEMTQNIGGIKGMDKKFLDLESRRSSTSPDTKKTFEDVAGIPEVKEELREIIDFLKDSTKYVHLGAKIPSGVLLVGPPGCGKTLLARAVAGEANVPFFSVSGSEFVEMFVGLGASRVRDLFNEVKKNAPCIVFIDEIDAVGKHRSSFSVGGVEEREQTVTQLLKEMDGFDQAPGVTVLAATNRPDMLDQALLRSGRFDRRIMVPLPDLEGRIDILRVHTRNKPLAPEVDLGKIARTMVRASGADLANLANEAALLAAKENKDRIEQRHLDLARDKILLGVERKTTVLSPKEKRIVAYHEAGHALVAHYLPEAEKIDKISIIPRGFALGVTLQSPTEDKQLYSRSYLKAMIAVILGGRVAEKIVFNDFSSTASDDLKRASDLAGKMVLEWGMGDENLLPPSVYAEEKEMFLNQYQERRPYSEETAQKLDEEQGKILKEAEKEAERILRNYHLQLERVAQALLEKETISREEFEQILKEG